MVNLLIKIVGRALGRKIESGSTIGAFFGTSLGVLSGISLAYLLVRFNYVDPDFAVAIYLISAIPCALAGALIGAAIGPRRPPMDARRVIRVSRYNRALGMLFVTLIFLFLLVMLIVFRNAKDASEMSRWEYLGVFTVAGLFSLIGVWVMLREVWYVDLGPTIFIRRIVHSKSYTRHDIRTWGFEIRPNEVIQRPFNGETHLCMEFNDGYLLKTPVRGEDSRAVVELLGAGGMAGTSANDSPAFT